MTNDLTATALAPILLITANPSHPLAHLALRYAQAVLEQSSSLDDNDRTHPTSALQVFFYGEAAQTANGLRWQSADQPNLSAQWQALAEQYSLRLLVCVSTALSRGISDADNSQRHQLTGDNLAARFELVGLGELAMMMQNGGRLMQF
ncbi:MAG: sulfurtransferase complex subunit TusD [Psychrobacter sp.]|nr:sulfurtransferase complex subunit TusD [Psychrobacter sp.]